MILCFLVGGHLLRRRESMKYTKWFILTIPSTLPVGKTSFLLCIERFFNVFFHIVNLFARVRCISPLNVRTHASEHVLLKDTYFCAGIVKLLAIIRFFSSLGFQTTFFQTTLNALCIVSRSLPDGWIDFCRACVKTKNITMPSKTSDTLAKHNIFCEKPQMLTWS